MAKGRKRQPARRRFTEHEAQVIRANLWAKTVGKLGAHAVRWGGAAFIVYQIAQVLTHWSGKTTIAELTVALSGTGWSGVVALAGLIFGGGGVAYGHAQARLRRKNTQYLGPRIGQLERMIDPKRSSSGLTTSGDTPEEEED